LTGLHEKCRFLLVIDKGTQKTVLFSSEKENDAETFNVGILILDDAEGTMGIFELQKARHSINIKDTETDQNNVYVKLALENMSIL